MSSDKRIELLKRKIEILEKMIEDNTREIYENNAKLQEQNAKQMYNAKLVSIGEMASSIAHEINNPIGIIEGQLRQLEYYTEKEDKWKQVEIIDKIQNNTKRVIEIVKGLKNLSKNSERENMKVISLNCFFEQFQKYNYVKTVDSKVEVEYPEFKKKLEVYGKDTALSQILINLINNAVDAVSNLNDPWVKVILEERADCIELRVVDSGEGIDEDHIPKLFDPFFTTKSFEKGTGVGLNVCKKLSQDLLGDLRYDLYRGNTSFVIELMAA